MAMATDRIEMLYKHFANNSMPLFEDAADEGLYTPS